MRRMVLLPVLALLFYVVTPQSSTISHEFTSPVDFRIYLSGSFAELRSGHFHSGIDIKTQGVEGKAIKAIDDGYVSRIKVQTNGYGKSVYVNHPGGYTSVYGHLSEYKDVIDNYVKKYQYKNQIHTLDIYPARNELPVKKGEIIAYSGNTGSSSGPHLHFEVRNAANQHPLNVQKFNFEITDNVDPRIYNFYLYSFEGEGKRRTIKSRKKIGLNLNGKTYRLKTGDTLTTPSAVSFGMEVYDFLNGVNNRCGIYYIKMFVDGSPYYHFQTDEFSFAETRFINAHTDYLLRTTKGEKVQLLFKRPYNRLSMYHVLKNDGIIDLLPGESKKIEVFISDISGNERKIEFWIKEEAKAKSENSEQRQKSIILPWNEANLFHNEMVKLEIPANSLYEDAKFSYSRSSLDKNLHPWLHHIGNPGIPMHSYASLSIQAEGIPPSLLSKACIVSYEDDGEVIYEGGKPVRDNWIEVRTRSFGNYGIAVDTLSPEIIPLNFRKNSDMSSKKSIKFIVRDDLSGIKSYKAYIDNNWVLFEYDPKNNLLFHEFDADRIEKGIIHEVEVYLEDDRGNKSMFHSGFRW